MNSSASETNRPFKRANAGVSVWLLALALFTTAAPWYLSADTLVWSRGPDLPVVYDEMRAAVLGGKLYVVGGRTGQGSGSSCVNAVLVYDPSTNQWSYAASLPENLAAVGLAAHGGYLYCFGGVYEPYWWGWPVRSAYRYNPTNNSWSRLGDMPIARSNFGMATIGEKIYCAGGNTHWPSATSRVDVYDTTTGTWSTAPDMPGARGGPICGTWGGKLVVAVGLASASSDPSKTVLVYDPQRNQWTQAALSHTLGHESGSLFADSSGLYCMGEKDGLAQPTCISRLHPDTGQVDFLTPTSPLLQEGIMTQAYDLVRGICYAAGGWTTTRTPTFQMAAISIRDCGLTVTLASGIDGNGHLLALNTADPFTFYTSANHQVSANAVVGKGQPSGASSSDFFGRGKSQTVTVDNLLDKWADFAVRFTLPQSDVYRLQLDCIGDDSAKVYLNGNLLGTCDQRDVQNNLLITHFDVTNQSWFVAGENELKFHTINTFTGHYDEGAIKTRTGVDGMSIQYEGCVSFCVGLTDRIYVNGSSGDDTKDGLGWRSAKKTVQGALQIAATGDEIWIARGTYKPGLSRTNSFRPGGGVALYGGFTGNELTREERNWSTNLTVLSGDLNGDDQGPNGMAENVYHVITLANDVTLDGVIVQGGNANAAVAPDFYGGGVYCQNATNVTVRNCLFLCNNANQNGGAFYSEDSLVVLAACRFATNSAQRAGGLQVTRGRADLLDCCFQRCSTTGRPGGGIYFIQTKLSLDRCMFLGNSSGFGGGIYGGFNSELSVCNSIFSLNRCGGDSQGGTSTGGALWLENHVLASVVNCTFAGNSDSHGLYSLYLYDHGVLRMTNCVIWNNIGQTVGGTLSSSILLSHCDVSAGMSRIYVDASSTATNAEDLLDVDPQFVTPPDLTTENYGNLRLRPNSPCIDTGTQVLASDLDCDGQPRCANGGLRLQVDIGAYEYVPPALVLSILSTNGCPAVIVSGVAGLNITLHYTTNLATAGAWSYWTNLVLPVSPFTLTDGGGLNVVQRFYRASTQ